MTFEFAPDHIHGIITHTEMQIRLCDFIGRRKDEITTLLSICCYFRDEVLEEAEAL